MQVQNTRLGYTRAKGGYPPPETFNEEETMRALTKTVATDLATTHEHLQAALKEQGFGILTEIDLRATFAEKLGVEHEEHKILGVCNPRLAKDALDASRDVALLLPCTATLRATPAGTEVSILDPEHAFTLADDAVRERLAPLAADAKERLGTALEALG
jgi:uncharacterized protein (DUF302 family)